MAALNNVELITALISFNWQLALVGLQLRILNGVVSLLTTRIESKALAAYLSEQSGASGTLQMTTATLEVLACIAFKQPISQAEIDRLFDADKRGLVVKLRDLKLVEEFLRLFREDHLVADVEMLEGRVEHAVSVKVNLCGPLGLSLARHPSRDHPSALQTRRTKNHNGAKEQRMKSDLKKVKLLTRDLRDGKRFPRSPRETLGGYALAARAVDKCRAVLVGWQGEYHSNCPLDQQWLTFAEIDYYAFKSFVATGATDVWIGKHAKNAPAVK